MRKPLSGQGKYVSLNHISREGGDGMKQAKGAKSAFAEGVRDGIPIALGYFAVAF